MKAKRINYLDGWRGIAILLLLIGHFLPISGVSAGTAGVDFFFALSGLLMGKLLFIQKTPIPVFYKRRFSRIFPGHYFFLAVTVAFYLLIKNQEDWLATLVSALFVYNYFPVLGNDVVMPYGHIWSLSVEEHSYIILSIVAVISRSTRVSAIKMVGFLALLSATLVIVYSMRFSGTDLTKMMMHTEVRGFSIFISVFFLLVFETIQIPKLSWEVYPALLFFCALLYWWSIPGQLALILAPTLLALVVNLLYAAPECIQKLLSMGWLRQCGMWSFSIYLWQQPFYMAYGEHFPQWLALACGVLMGIFSFYVIEQPVRTYLNNSWGKE